MLTGAIFVAFSQTEVNDVDVIFSGVCTSDQEIVRLDVSVNDSLLVNFLDYLNHLDCYVQAALKIKLASTLLKEIFQ